MKIGFLISGIGIYGSVREVVENCNVLTDLGNECFLFNPEGERVKWIGCKATVLLESKLKDYELDALFLCAQPNNHYLRMFTDAKAKTKIFVLMGFDTEFDIFKLQPNLQYIKENFLIGGDSKWQVEYFRKFTPNLFEPQIGGINTEMFRPLQKNERTKLNIGWSGDMRMRKGGTTLKEFFDTHKYATMTYFNKGIKQEDFAKWFNKIDIFVDNHYSGGWCNPVAEAMACGVPVICSDVLCNAQFAVHEITCLKFRFNDFRGLKTQLHRMINEGDLRNHLGKKGHEKIQEFDYKIIGKRINDRLNEN